ncbi:MAG TPA: HDIG domain-containing protein [bacterium]|nr:HDIG domain-containing protein [bacterium]HPS29953.1 HDIG domain-containing protein [bacterium]
MKEEKRSSALSEKIEELQTVFNRWLRLDDGRAAITMGTFFAIIFAFMSIPDSMKIDYPVSEKEIGTVLKYSVRANRDYTIINEEKTKQNRLQAEKSVPLYFQYIEDRTSNSNVKAAFSYLRNAAKNVYSVFLKNESDYIPVEFKNLAVSTLVKNDDIFKEIIIPASILEKLETEKNEFQRIIGFPVSDEIFLILLKTGLSPEIENAVEELISKLNSFYLTRDGIAPEYDLPNISLKRNSSIGSVPVTSIITSKTLREEINHAQKLLHQEKILTDEGLELVSFLASWSIRDNIVFLPDLTEAEKLAVWNEAPKEEFTIRTGEVIKRAGEIVTAKDIMIFREMAKQSSGKSVIELFLLNLVFIFIVYSVLYFAFKKTISKFNSRNKDILLMGTQVVFMLLLFDIIVSLSVPFSQWMGNIDARIFYFLVPVPFLVATVRLLINTETSLFFLMFLMLFFLLLFPDNFYFPMFYFIGSIFYTFLVTHIEKRGNIIKVSMFLSLLMMILVVVIFLMDSTLPVDNIPRAMLFAFLGSLFSGMLLMATIPVYEWWLGYTTDITFLEYSTLNHPLMKRMAVHANGTYQHSLTVASMVEVAAREIGLSSLACKVMAYFHDIGKLERPGYFSENQTGKNIHDELPSHSMSAMVIINHVKQGLELARKYRLGEKIEDAVSQHHGTTLVEYFYTLAKNEDPSVSESTYSYPGPKPKSREAALLMIADSSEAAVRSLPDKSFQKISETVNKIVNKKLNSGQLSECSMTLKDLNKIEASLIKTLSGIYHARVEYPDSK